MTELLFVYGSLMSTVPSAASRWLSINAEFISRDAVKGHLFDLGQYPGLVLDEKGSVIEGELHKLHDLQRALEYLDAYEGTHLYAPEYERIGCSTIAGYQCWLYQFIKRDSVYPLIASRNYNTYYPTNPHHFAFIRRADASTSN